MKQKIKIGATIVFILVVVFNLYTILRLQTAIANMTNNTLSYIQTSNKTFEKIICAQQIQGEWDLNKCPQ